jgi:pyruvate dehydrogenase E2 component (dihydrolipoamide acetyltransferase)
MSIPIRMPALSPSLDEARLVKWLVNVGDVVRPGKIIAEIESDKATMAVEALDEGVVVEILVAAGVGKVRVGTQIAMLRLPTETVEEPGSRGDRRFISPLASGLARDAGVDIASLTGTGPQGRIVQRDIEKAKAGIERQRDAAPARPVPSNVTRPTTGNASAAPMVNDVVRAVYDPVGYEVVPHDSVRKANADRLILLRSTVPQIGVSIDVRLDTLLAARDRVNARSPKDGPRAYKLSVSDFVIKALALALIDVPAANATWTAEGILRHRHADIGAEVPGNDAPMQVVIKHAELKSLTEISNEMKELTERARQRRLSPHENQGGTSSVSDLGHLGIRSFESVINPPHATALAVGAAEKRPIVVKDAIEVAVMMTATLSCDLRVVDAVLGAELLNAFKSFIEDPVRMLV